MIKLVNILLENQFSEYSNSALADMIVNLSRFEGNEELIASVKDELESRKNKMSAANLEEGDDHEVAMAQASLKSIIRSSAQLMSKLGMMERDIPGWIQNHITNAENYIDQAAQGFHELHHDE
jgi:hypothetical protein